MDVPRGENEDQKNHQNERKLQEAWNDEIVESHEKYMSDVIQTFMKILERLNSANYVASLSAVFSNFTTRGPVVLSASIHNTPTQRHGRSRLADIK